MKFELDDLTEGYAQQISRWKYTGDYSVYNLPSWETMVSQNWAITQEQKRKNEYAAVINESGELYGFFRMIDKSDSIFVGLGLDPAICGQGLGNMLMGKVKQECFRRYGNKKITLEVRSFNDRAVKCYKKAGFKVIDVCEKDTHLGHDEYVIMEFSY